MVAVLLRRATQIVNRINREAAFEVEGDEDDPYMYRRKKKKVLTLNATATVNIDANPFDRVTNLHDTLLVRKDQMFALLEIGTRIRKAMGEVQAKVGVTGLVTERVMVIRQQSVLEHLLGAVSQTVYDKTAFSDQVISMRGRLNNATTNAKDAAEITTVLLNAEDRASMRSELTALKRRLMEIDDKLAELNATNSIDLSEKDEAVLREAGIV